ncbi:acetyl/propionyl/methylcrotonyl-CoA carboxylase subunit alpha [Proteobacteria bacterium 005FR1]|nr:acetyl/propionyl/methylcrotonyl-CoA carboxylase subunit alpha [Proteobacteria bacterium 005FR1]
MFDKLLIANRGEIAVRVIRTARRMGIRTVAVYSEADRNAMHVQAADEAIAIGPAAAQESYLRGERIIEAAKRTGAGAIHPGYGFLSENTHFSDACEKAGIVFVGPPAGAIDIMGSKSKAKRCMVESGIPVLPGYHGDDQSLDVLAKEAEAIGYPVLLKAAAGGGGKGMRRVDRPEDLASALAGAKRESAASFGDDTMLVEKLLLTPRHVEVQVFCDSHGNGVYLFERDCSSQRRHQKIIEEAPAPELSEDIRKAMGETAVRAAQAIDYRGAGTVEFLFDDKSGEFYFMEMNTRLQVEHPVTEMITGQDLVEWQLRVAAGERLPLLQSELQRKGHSFEARIYAEDPDSGFLPATGTLTHLSTPTEDDYVRIDTGVREGDEISPWYDPMIAKLIVWGEDRNIALRRLKQALSEYRIAGLSTNIAFLYNLAADEAFTKGAVHTRYVEDNLEDLVRRDQRWDRRDRALAGLYLALAAGQQHNQNAAGDDRFSPWGLADAWRVAGPRPYHFHLLWHDEALLLQVEAVPGAAGKFRVDANGEAVEVEGSLSGKHLYAIVEGHRFTAEVADSGSDITLFTAECAVRFTRSSGDWEHEAGHGGFTAPMNGRVVQILAEAGQPVKAGDPLLVLEAMKMEHTMNAPADGKVESFHCGAGDLVNSGQVLLEFSAEEKAEV